MSILQKKQLNHHSPILKLMTHSLSHLTTHLITEMNTIAFFKKMVCYNVTKTKQMTLSKLGDLSDQVYDTIVNCFRSTIRHLSLPIGEIAHTGRMSQSAVKKVLPSWKAAGILNYDADCLWLLPPLPEPGEDYTDNENSDDDVCTA